MEKSNNGHSRKTVNELRKGKIDKENKFSAGNKIINSEESDEDLINPSYPTMDHISSEVLLLIFTFLNTSEISKSVMPVCKRWNTISHHPSLWLALNFKRYDHHKYGCYMDILSRSTLIESLKISHIQSSFLHRCVSQCSTLRKLVIQATMCISRRDILAVVNGCPNLTYIDLSKGTQGYSNMSVLHEVTNLKKLKTLKVESCNWVNSSFVNKIALRLTQLESLDLECNLLPPEVLANLIVSLQNSLKQLSVKCEMITTEIIYALHQCKKMESFNIKVLLGPITLSQDHMCSHMDSLQKLTLFNCCVRITENAEMCFGGTCFINLTELYVYNASGDDKLALDLALNLPKLQFLHLEAWSRITDDGIDVILRQCQFLRSFYLVSCCSVYGNSLSRCASATPTRLQSLLLEGCTGVSESVADAITSGNIPYCLIQQ